MRAVLAVLALVLVAGAAAADSTLALRTHEPIALAGALEITMEDASLLVQDRGAPAERALHAATGRISVWTWRTAHADAGVLDWAGQTEDAQLEEFYVRDATIRVRTDGAPFHLSVRMMEGGNASVRGGVDARAQPRTILRAAEEPAADPALPMARPDDVPWAYAPGWILAGNALAPPNDEAFPLPAGAVARIEGAARLKLENGVVTFVTSGGEPVERELGIVAKDLLGETRRRLVFEGSLAPSALEVDGVWALAGPRASWTLDGAARFVGATGVATRDGEARAFDDAVVIVDGRLVMVPHPAGDPREPSRYEARGEMSVVVDGRPLGATARPAGAALAPVATTIVTLAALGGIAWRFSAPFYTRLAPADVLAHPRRRAIVEAATLTPGARQRDLQRALGLAWGAFTFHLRVLVRAGHLRLERQGAYTLVLPVAPRVDAPLIAHPVARAVWRSIPADGVPIPFVALRARLGFSRQRLNHHLDALAARGLVRVAVAGDGERHVVRMAQTPAPITE